MTRFLIKRKNLDTETQRHAHRENAGEDESTDKNEVQKCFYKPRNTKDYKNPLEVS